MRPLRKSRKGWAVLGFCLSLALLASACAPTPAPTAPLAPVAVTPAPSASLRLFLIYGGDVSETWGGQVRIGLVETLVREGQYQLGETLMLGEYRLPLDVGTLVAPGKTAIADAIAQSQAFAPDILITVGNQATRQVVSAYPDPHQRIVFCSFSGDVIASGLNRPNVTGVLELPYPIQTGRLAVSMLENPAKFMVLGDVSSTDNVATEVIFEALLKDPPHPATPIWRQTDDWEEWQAFVQEAATLDFVILGKYDHVHDAAGALVPPDEVLRWTLLNSEAPVFGLWQETVTRGAVGGLVLSGEEQGKSAARLALRIVGGTDPAALLPQRPERNILTLNLAAARHWGLLAPFELLVTASVGGTFPAP
ncbi:MAG TPA: ABC transporter substrate binding protein [Anaerolineae bacterium]|nr:ABC transporter substrate binding protein [Anaerolineae bacterium]